jgi:DNA-directed RNA polymerase specialized sigma subunit
MNYYKTTEKFLYNYRPLKISIENMESELKELEPLGASAIDYSKEKTGATYNISKQTEDEALHIITQKEILKDRIEKTKKKVERIEKGLSSLSPIEKEIISRRYFESEQWYEIAYKVKYHESWCKEIRKRAIIKLSVALFGVEAVRVDEYKTQA